MGIQYRFPLIYKFFIRFLHNKKVVDVFNQEVGKNNKVFDIAAGFGQMADYIDSSNKYSGIDLNKHFVKYGKSKGLELKIGNVFDEKVYKKSDVIIAVDLIHHLPLSKLKPLFEAVFKNTRKKVVIMEPTSPSLVNIWGPMGKIADRFIMWIDSDGINKITKWLSDAEYNELFKKRFGAKEGNKFDLKIQKIFPYYLVTYEKISN